MATVMTQAGGLPADLKLVRLPGSAGMAKRTERIVLGTVFIVVLFIAWEITALLQIEPPILLPSPGDVLQSFEDMFSSPDIWLDFSASGQEFIFGFAMAASIGIVIGLLVGWYVRIGYLIDPFVSFLYAIPRVALGPLLIVWLGIGLSSKVALIFLTAVFPVLINTASGIRSLDSHLVRVARCYGANDFQIFRTVALPGSVPFILGGLRLAVGQSLIAVFVAELLGAQHGLGALINNAGQQFQTATVFAGLVFFAAAGMILTAFMRWLERVFDAWRV